MPTPTWPQKRRLLGTKIPRIDGGEKSTGKAKYSFDINLEGLLHAVMVRSPLPHAKIKSIDTTAAEKVKGFKALHFVKKAGEECFFVGDEILAIAADTEEHALDAVRALKIDLEALPFVVREAQALKLDKDPATMPPFGAKAVRANFQGIQENTRGDLDAGIKAADVAVEATYGMPAISHQCLESHGLVAKWGEDGSLTVWASTQAVPGTAGALAGYFRSQKVDLPNNKVRCITHYMGGGFGSKFGPDVQGIVACELARKAKAPVKLMLDRESEVTVGGNRPSAYGTVKIHGKKDGTITAFESNTFGSPGVGRGGTVGPMPYVYPVVAATKHTAVRLNFGSQRAMRAPGHPQSCFFTDSAVDDFAAKIGMDPMQVRLKNLPKDDEDLKQNNPTHFDAMKGTLYREQFAIAARLSGWKEKWHAPGKGPTKGPWKHGIGMALHTWGGGASAQINEVEVTIGSDGSVLARTSSQDLGTAQRTLNAIVTAEILGLQVGDIRVELGESQFGPSSGSGGSTTAPVQAPATLLAASDARDKLFARVAAKLGAKTEDLEIIPGKVRDKASSKEYAWKQVCAMMGKESVKGTGQWNAKIASAPGNENRSNQQVGGVQIAEVWVDTETGVVKCEKIVAVQDCGLLINKLACESQVAGGVIMGLNYALYEELIIDANTGRVVNPDMEFYKLGGINDMPRIVVHMMDMPERGVIGIGEPPTISTHAAIGNAIHNALGVRVPRTPFSPDQVLAALTPKGGN